MRAYRWSTNLKLGLIVFAVVIAVASLWYTRHLVESLREREQSIIQLWAGAQQQVAQAQAVNPYQAELNALEAYLERAEAEQSATVLEEEQGASKARIEDFRRAVAWAKSMPPASELNFITNNILIPNSFGIPAIITDSASRAPLFWRNVDVPEGLAALPAADSARAAARLVRLRAEMDDVYEPIPIALGGSTASRDRLTQFVHYDESRLIKELRWFPYVQLLFVALFIGIGYLGFSYVRRSEQSSLWVGMAREAAHQLGTPISSLMGWTELLKADGLSRGQRREALEEIENDIERLKRVTSRFSDIGSLPKLKAQPVAPPIERTVAYIRRRVPQAGQRVTLEARVPAGLQAPLNAELFEWVIENLLKNALDSLPSHSGAIDAPEGRITVEARQDAAGAVVIDVEDTGRGIDRRQWKNVFRPGYSTKKRGWGLGLSLAHRIIDDYHGGTLSVAQSKPGEGTTFRIELPAAEGTGSR